VIGLPPILGGAGLFGWRLDQEVYAHTWDSGEGAFRQGGRWNKRGTRAVYASIDAATAILEVAVHKTFPVLDTVPHVLTSFQVSDPHQVHIIQPSDVPNPNWLLPGIPSAGQQQFGNDLLSKHLFLLIPSAVSNRSWNLVFDAVRANGHYTLHSQDRFGLDGRLSPPES
jgi:RES domain-containing protein